jgi:hypothetical protein
MWFFTFSLPLKLVRRDLEILAKEQNKAMTKFSKQRTTKPELEKQSSDQILKTENKTRAGKTPMLSLCNFSVNYLMKSSIIQKKKQKQISTLTFLQVS